MIDLDAYLRRIGLRGRPDIEEVHRAHSLAIPFENLDPHAGRKVSLEQADLEAKLVRAGRGGYCFEQNLLLASAMRALGADVRTHLARVRYGAPPGSVRPRSHLVLEVRAGGSHLLADVGFGLGTLFDPIPFAPGPEAQQSGWAYRSVLEGPLLVLQVREQEAWRDLYAFPHGEEALPIDIEVSNWFTSTHPRSPFVAGIVIAAQRADGTRLSLTDAEGLRLRERTPEASSVQEVALEEVPGLLAERFGLAGVSLADEGRLRPAG